MKKTLHFNLDPTSRIVEGEIDDLFLNLTFQNYFSLTKEISLIVISHHTNQKQYSELSKKEDVEKKILDFFINRNLAYLSQTPANISFTPAKIGPIKKLTNVIIEYNSRLQLEDFMENLVSFGCRYFEFRIANVQEITKLDLFIKKMLVKYNFYFEIIVFVKRHTLIGKSELNVIQNMNSKLILQDNCRFFEIHNLDRKDFKYSYVKAEETTITERNFVVSNKLFSEAEKLNIGLYGKLFIDKFGNIKQFPTHKTIFGNINNSVLLNVVKQIEKTNWLVPKSSIENCSTCKYRMVCCDFAEIEFVNKIYKRRKECTYQN